STGTLATGSGNARFVSVTVRPVTLQTILPAAIFGGANTVTTAASAVAGFDQVVCGVTPIHVCNPYETAGMTYDEASEALQHAAANPSDQGRLMRLRQYTAAEPATTTATAKNCFAQGTPAIEVTGGEAQQLRRSCYGGNALYAAEDYGVLTFPTVGSDELSLVDSLAVVPPAACLLQPGGEFPPALVPPPRPRLNVP